MKRAFEWDPAKASLNIARHGVSFEIAVEVFFDPNTVYYGDAAHSTTTERRDHAIGFSQLGLLLIVFTEREGVIRIISVRRANKRERNFMPKNKRIDYSDIPPLRLADYKKGRHFTDEERAKFAEAYINTFHKAPPRVGRPLKYAGGRLKAISIRLHPDVLRWAKKEGHKQHMGYQSFLSEFLLRHAA